MPRLEGGPHGLKADPSARADDQDYRHGVMLPVGPAWLTVMCDAGSRTARWAGRLEKRFQGRSGRTPRAWPSHPIRVCHGSSIVPCLSLLKTSPTSHRNRASSICSRFICPRPGKECLRNAVALSREKLLHLVESFLKST